MRKIILYPDPVLRTKTETVDKVDKNLLSAVADLKEVLAGCDNGAGLAATQIGLSKRFFGLKDLKTKKVQVLINPKIRRTFGRKAYIETKNKEGVVTDFMEGCLSFPDLFGRVKRYLKIEAEWQEIENNKLMGKSKTMEGFEAIVFQHEADHLDGILFIDHVKRNKQKIYRWIGEKMEEVKVC